MDIASLHPSYALWQVLTGDTGGCGIWHPAWKNVIRFMRIGTADEAAYILLIAFTAIMDAALKERIAARMEDGMVRLIAGMLSHAVERLQKNADIQPCATCNP